MGKKSKQRNPPDGRKVNKDVFLVSSPRIPVNCDRITSLRLLLGFKHSIPVTPDSYEFMSKLPKQKIGVKASSPPRNVEDSDELSAACIGSTKTWIENKTKGEVLRGQELTRHHDSFLKAGPSSANVMSSTNVLFDSSPRNTLSQDQLFHGESPSVGNIKKHPGIYPLRQEEAVCQEPTMKVAKVKPRLTVMEQHCQEHITKQIKGLLLQKHKAKAQRTRKSHTCQETKPNLGKEGRTVASERPQIRKKKQPLCFTGVLTSGGKKFCPQRKKGTGFAKSVHQKVQKMGPSTPITPSQESEKIWDLDKALEFIEGAPLIHKKDSKMKKKAPGTIRIPPGCPDKEVPGLDLSSKVLKAETMKEQEEEEEEEQQQKQQEEEQEEEVEDEKNWIPQKKKQVKRDKAGEVWHEFGEFLENEAFPNYEIVKRRPKKTRQVRQEKEKTVKWRWSEMKEEELQEQDEGENIQKLEVIVKKRPKRTPKKKVS